jgi:hypothetical protein
MSYKKLAIAVLASSLLLTACGSKPEGQQPANQPKQEAGKDQQTQPSDQVKAYKEMVDELAKGKDGGKVDYDKVLKLYHEQFKKLVQARDSEYSEQLDQQISSALQAGKEGAMKPDVVQQIVDKLGQKVFFLTMRHDFNEVDENFADKVKAKAELEEAKAYYGILKSSVQKRDNAYQLQLAGTIDGAFNDMSEAVDKGRQLDFALAKQVADKTLMKNFYLAVGGANGYAYKIEKAVKEGKDPKVEQAEGWAFNQSLYGYIVRYAKEDAELIQNKFDLKTDTKDMKGDDINKAFVRAFAAVAKHEYAESFENLGKDKGAITAMEGALFIQVIEGDAKQLLGEAQTKTLLEKAGSLLAAVKANDKAKAESLYKEIEPSLDKLAKAGK